MHDFSIFFSFRTGIHLNYFYIAEDSGYYSSCFSTVTIFELFITYCVNNLMIWFSSLVMIVVFVVIFSSFLCDELVYYAVFFVFIPFDCFSWHELEFFSWINFLSFQFFFNLQIMITYITISATIHISSSNGGILCQIIFFWLYYYVSVRLWHIFLAIIRYCRTSPTSRIMTGSTYSVQPGTYRLVLCYSIIPTCTSPFEYVLFIPNTYLVRPSTYSVRTSQISMYSVRTEYRKHDKSTYFRLKVQTIRITYQYVPVRTEYILYCLFSYRLFFISKGYIPGTCWLWWSMYYFWFLILLRARRAA
jgi:hypothetical protein